MKRQNNRNYTLYICIEIIMIVIGIIIGFEAFSVLSEMDNTDETYFMRLLLSIVIGISMFVILEVCRRIAFKE